MLQIKTNVRRFRERVQKSRSRVRNDQHVAFLNFLKAANGGAIKTDALGQAIKVERTEAAPKNAATDREGQ